jgi:mRNA-degrading endonuclease toxin of MazEF toxin-antitoxin module
VGAAGLHEESVVLLDQIRAAQESRIESYIGSLTEAEYEPIRNGIRRMFDI